MRRGTYQLLAAIYKILSDFDSRAIEKACHYPGLSRDVRAALECLLHEAREREYSGEVAWRTAADDPVADRPTRPSVSSRPKSSGSRPKSSGSKPARSKLTDSERIEQAIKNYLSDKRRFPDKDALRAFIDGHKLGIQIDPKQGLPRAVNAVVRRIMEDPNKTDAVRSVVQAGRDNQTAGWLDLILKQH